ncbi:MAG: glycoside hydrolase family 16 protein [Bacteroidetes bacterium]|nr:glycoside hydrolase family 16 protein [Bacteroidota bacterium]
MSSFLLLLYLCMGCKSGTIEVPIVDSTKMGCDYQFNESTLISNGWTKTFEDNFDADLSKWNIWNSGAYNNELQLYQTSNLELATGILTIKAKKETVSGATLPTNSTIKKFDYSSGRIESKTTISANSTTPKIRIIARMQLPKGYGLWPAFWSYGDPWPTQGEIDYVEARGNNTFQYLTNYYYGSNPGIIFNEDNTGFINTVADLSACFHVYEFEWTQTSLNSYLDGKLVESKKSGNHIMDLFGKNENVVFNLAIGGGFFPNLNPVLIETGNMYIDWVKVFASK